MGGDPSRPSKKLDCGEKSGKGPKGLQRSPRSRGIVDRRLRFWGVLGGPWRALSGLQGTFSALQVLYSAARASVGMASAWPLPNLPLRLRLFLKDALFDFEPSGDLQRGSCCVEPRGPSRLPGDRPRTGWTGTPRHTFDNPSTLWHHPRHVFDSWVWNFVWVWRGTLAGCRASRATAETSVLFYMSSVFRPIRRAQLEPWQRPLNFPISISLSSMLKVRMEHRSAMSRRPALSCPALLPPSLRTPDSFPRIQDSRT